MQLSYTLTQTSKPVMLLLHGFLGSASQWDVLTTSLETHWDLLLVELPGHGASVVHSSTFSIDDIAQAISTILDKHAIQSIHVVGHSMGGYVGSAFAKAYSHKVLSLTLINSITGPDTGARKLLRDRAIALIETHQQAYISMAVSNLFTAVERAIYNQQINAMKIAASTMSLTAITQSLEAMRDRQGVTGSLTSATFPITYIYGTEDAILPETVIEKECLALNAKGVKINGGHMLIITNTNELQKMSFSEL